MVGKTVVYTGANGEFELAVGKRKAYAVVVQGFRIVSGAVIASGESVTIVVGHLRCAASVVSNLTAFSPYASRTGKTAHRKRRICKAEQVVLDTRHAQAHLFCANGALSGYRRWGTYAI
jgi:hypothetical protein